MEFELKTLIFNGNRGIAYKNNMSGKINVLKHSHFFLIFCFSFAFFGCGNRAAIETDWLDSPSTLHPSVTDSSYRLSTRIPTPDAATVQRPVIIALHGFTATPYEWEEFRNFAEARSNVLVSLVLMGGHGHSYEAFKKATWKDWGQPFLREYQSLAAKGYHHISIAAASGGGSVVLKFFEMGAFHDLPPPRYLFLIDTLVAPMNKKLDWVPYLGPFVSDQVDLNKSEEESQHWYKVKPREALSQLARLSAAIRKDLKKGIRLPEGTSAIVYQSMGDTVVDPESAKWIYKGLLKANGEPIEVEMVSSNLHVFTRLQGRKQPPSQKDRMIQRYIFNEILQRVSR